MHKRFLYYDYYHNQYMRDKFSNFGSDPNELAYDLRQSYSIIVGEHLQRVAEFRMEKNYPKYFDSLEDLYTVVSHKFKKNKKEETTTYEELKKEAIDIFNKNIGAYNGSSTNTKGVSEVESVLRMIERFLYKKMDKAKMFGAKDVDEGLF